MVKKYRFEMNSSSRIKDHPVHWFKIIMDFERGPRDIYGHDISEQTKLIYSTFKCPMHERMGSDDGCMG
jgi:hypothetical protein